MTIDDKSTRVAYVFDAVADRGALKQFEQYLSDAFNILEEDEQPVNEPQVIYTFKAFSDRYELAEFQRGPNYGRAINDFDMWLRAKHKYTPDSMSDVELKLLEKIWDAWCDTLVDNDAVAE